MSRLFLRSTALILIVFTASMVCASGFSYPDSIYDYEAVDQKPELVKKVMPEYPKNARKSGLEGTVVLSVIVDEKGKVFVSEVVKSVEALDEAAKKAALKTKFKPGKHGGECVKVKMKIPFMFRLE